MGSRAPWRIAAAMSGGVAFAAVWGSSTAQAPVEVALVPSSSPTTTADGPWVEVEDGHTGETVRILESELSPPPEVMEETEASLRAAMGMPPRDERPRAWAEGPTRCSRYGRRRYCDGPLRVPEPVGPEARDARTLGLGTRIAGAIALSREPRAPWLAAVRGMAFPEEILWPVDGGSFVRGLKRDRRVRVIVRRGGRRVTRFVVRPGHNGVDIAARPGTHALAIADGLVVYAGNEMRGYGNVVLVLHGNGSISLYSHLSAAWVFAGQTLLRGQIVGEVGDTGLATGPHLHFEWRRNGTPLDPVPRFGARPRRPGEPEPPHEPHPEIGEEEAETIEIDDEDDLAPTNL